MYKDFMINGLIVRVQGNLTDEVCAYIEDFKRISIIFDLKEFVSYLEKRTRIIGYVGGKATRKRCGYDYIIYTGKMSN